MLQAKINIKNRLDKQGASSMTVSVMSIFSFNNCLSHNFVKKKISF
jgi:hypothetical protein